MAKIQEQAVVIRLSKLVKTGQASSETLIADDTLAALESVVAELVGDDSVVVEVESASLD